MLKKSEVVLPRLINISGVIVAVGFAFAFVNSFLFGIDVLNGWFFVLATSIVSLVPAVVILVVMFRSQYYRVCNWNKKWPTVTILIVSMVVVGCALACNGIGHFVNFYASSSSVYVNTGVVTSKTRMGYKQYMPHVTVRIGDHSGEKRVNKEVWSSVEIGDQVIVLLRKGYLGFVNIIAVKKYEKKLKRT